MSKRFIDTGFLDQKWIRKLPPEQKIFLIYLMLKCDNGGIIDLDIEDIEFWIGKEIGTLDFLPENYLISLNDSGKYFMPKFIEWQYKDMSSQKFIVAQARQILEKHNLINIDFTLNLPKSYVNVTKNVSESQEQGTGIGKGTNIGKGKRAELNFDFVSEDFKSVFDQWIDYKRSRKEMYKTQRSLETCYNQLLKFSGKNPAKAKDIIDQSIASNYQGFFPLKFISNEKTFGIPDKQRDYTNPQNF
jgi:hypothetical protein